MQSTLLRSLRGIYESVAGPLGEGASADILLVSLAGAVARACERWPAFASHTDALVARLATIAGTDPGASACLDQLAVEDLLLAAASLANDREAVTTVEKIVRDAIRPVLLRRHGSETARIEEATQLTLMKVMFGESAGREPRLAQYEARGPLTAWVRMVAVRIALDLITGGKEHEDVDASLIQAALISSDDPELRVLLAHYAPRMAEALRKAVTALTDREGALLRWSLVEGLSIDDIGRIYGCHRATADRWLRAAKSSLRAHAEREFCGVSKASASEFHSLMRALPGYFDVSLERMLMARAPDEPSQ